MTPKDANGEPTSVDRWNHAVRQAYGGGRDALVDEVLAMSDAEVEAELAVVGVDMATFDAKMSALYDEHVAGADPAPRGASERIDAWASDAPNAPDARPGKRGVSKAAIVAYATAAAVAAGGVAAYLASRPDEEPKPTPPPPTSATATAAPPPPPPPTATERPAKADDSAHGKGSKR
jgi:hypothetical protein